MSDADAKIKAGTHVLMPVKPTPEMNAAIERYFFSRVFNRGAEKKDNARRDHIFAQCWGAAMAYEWMVEEILLQQEYGPRAESMPAFTITRNCAKVCNCPPGRCAAGNNI